MNQPTAGPAASSSSSSRSAAAADAAADELPGTTESRLAGYHRSWRVVRPHGELAALGRLKAGGPRIGVPRFDPRCFPSEEDLLVELARYGVPRVPPVYRLGKGGGLQVHGFIEGEPLSRQRPPHERLTGRQLAQLMALFSAMARIRPTDLALLHHCPPRHRPRTSGAFLRTLLHFTRHRVYTLHAARFAGLFTAFGVDPEVLAPDGPLGRAAGRLTDRPFCLLHGDLHRDNLIVAAGDGALWTIDWELALLGDPVYDLATHLHLTHYPRSQQPAVIGRWARTMPAALPGAADGLAADLPVYLAYKRVQSVFTDVIRHALAVRAADRDLRPVRIARATQAVGTVLTRAAPALGLARIPSPATIERAYTRLAG
ncbi:aminoglycoside phosphotransferase family protein [Streptomyces aidingensis]|uniref:Phosphotransferase enzyme family protein n=1 Tax=Streptomyces aidingensis TaxID=910347 RepID=A0A1I1HRR3_9ACTN|nr:aminoglycoside phosphotransferase family protein [Streptomyces aidingensis]SFC26556.1 Phosphotransferase enzyme family protein [Streptomyces aidingensis]